MDIAQQKKYGTFPTPSLPASDFLGHKKKEEKNPTPSKDEASTT